MGDSFRMYLRDTMVINQQHREALDASSKEVSYLITQDNALPDLIPEDFAMGEYIDDMD